MHCLIESLGRRAAYNTPVLTQASGCVCCKVRDDLAAALKRLAVELAATSLTTSEASAVAETGSGGGGGGGGGGAIEAVLIETSGLSEVRPTSRPCISRGRRSRGNGGGNALRCTLSTPCRLLPVCVTHAG